MAKRRHQSGAYKSGLERDIAAQLTALKCPFLYERFRMPFIPRKLRHYTPDFLLPNGIVVESKGYFVSSDRAKHLEVQAQHPKIDVRFIFAEPHRVIGKGSNTTYAKWAESKGFKWATLRVPLAWIKEPVNHESLAAAKLLIEEGKKSAKKR